MHKPNKVTVVFKKIKSIANDKEFKQNFVEEIIGNFSSSSFIAFFSILGGGIAVFAHPVVGTIILIMSIAYGSFLKVFFGKYYRQKYNNNRKVSPDGESKRTNLEKGILDVFKKWGTSSSMKYIKTSSARYGFIRLTSRHSNRSRKVSPESLDKIKESSK